MSSFAPTVKLIAYRLYLSAQVLVTAASVLLMLWCGINLAHDRQVAAVDFACFDRETSTKRDDQPPRLQDRADPLPPPRPEDRLPDDPPPRPEDRLPSPGKSTKATDARIHPKWQSAPEVSDPWTPPTPEEIAAAKCHIRQRPNYLSREFSSRAWNKIYGTRELELDSKDTVVLGVALIAPLALFGLYRWARWLARPPPT